MNQVYTMVETKTGDYEDIVACLDSGCRLNVAPMKYWKYVTHERKIVSSVEFETPTGERITAAKYGDIHVRLKMQGYASDLDIGQCATFFIAGNWNELLIGDRTLQFFGLSPVNILRDKLIAADKAKRE